MGHQEALAPTGTANTGRGEHLSAAHPQVRPPFRPAGEVWLFVMDSQVLLEALRPLRTQFLSG